MKIDTEFYKQLNIFNNTATATLECMLTHSILESLNIPEKFEEEYGLSSGQFRQLIFRQKITYIQYMYTLFDSHKGAFDLEKFMIRFCDYFKEAKCDYYGEIAVKLYKDIRKDIAKIRNNIASHSSEDEKGQKIGYESFSRVSFFQLDIITTLLRLISYSFRNHFKEGHFFVPAAEHREALLLEEIKNKINDNSMNVPNSMNAVTKEILTQLCQTISMTLIQEYYSKGIHPIYNVKTGHAVLSKIEQN